MCVAMPGADRAHHIVDPSAIHEEFTKSEKMWKTMYAAFAVAATGGIAFSIEQVSLASSACCTKVWMSPAVVVSSRACFAPACDFSPPSRIKPSLLSKREGGERERRGEGARERLVK